MPPALARPALAFVAAAAACAPLPQRSASAPIARRAPVDVDQVLTTAATQVRRCYRSPQVSSEGRQIVTRVRVRFSADGQLTQLPVVIAQDGINPRNRSYAGRMAEAAIGAVMRCTPLRLPSDFPADRTIAFDLTFSPLSPA